VYGDINFPLTIKPKIKIIVNEQQVWKSWFMCQEMARLHIVAPFNPELLCAL
jgi:hypothetical protein